MSNSLSNKIIQENKAVYDAIADQFSLSRDARFGELPLLLPYLEGASQILDLGCGAGRLYQFLAKNQLLEGRTYIGTDQSSGQVAIAQKQFPDGDFRIGSLHHIDLLDNSVDTIACIATFHHLPDEASRLQCLREITRVLEPGGRLLMSNWNLGNRWSLEKSKEEGWDIREEGSHYVIPWKDKDRTILGYRHYWKITPEEHIALYKKAGLDLQEWFYTCVDKKETDPKEGMNIVSIANS